MNKQLKQQIIDNAVEKSGLLARLAQLSQEHYALAEHARLSQLSELYPDTTPADIEAEEKDFCKKFNRIMPTFRNGFLNKEQCIRVLDPTTGERFYLYFSENQKAEDRVEKVVAKDTYYNQAIADAARLVDKKITATKEEIRALRRDTEAYLSNFRSIKKLLQQWKEAASLLPASEQSTTSCTALTNISPQKLNQVIGI